VKPLPRSGRGTEIATPVGRVRPARGPALFHFSANTLWVNALLFAAAAGLIWFAGTKLERLADSIARRTGLGQAFVGVLLLAAATSLPEIATTVTAVAIGNTSLAVHNLLGSVVFNTVVLVVADAVADRKALTNRAPRYVLLIEGLGVVFLLGIVLTGAAVGRGIQEPIRTPLLGAGLWELLLLVAYGGVIYATYLAQKDPRWVPEVAVEPEPKSESKETPDRYEGWSNRTVYAAFAGASLVVLAAGYVVARTGDALATQTGLGAGFVGFVLVAVATSLPELSTTIAAARQDNDEMAFSNIFGSSAFVVAMLAVVGLMSGPAAVIQSASPSASFAAALGILVTCVYLWGLLERRDRSFLRMGWDSIAVLVLTVVGTLGLYALK
jgi:cation:H+ antiporter